jgi:gluconolactonase
MVTAELHQPNGLCFSPDESILYISETGAPAGEPRPHIRAFDVLENGRGLGRGRVLRVFDSGNADGFRCDEDGNLWCGAADGVHCVAPDGALLGRVILPTAVANVAFGGLKKNRLFICASQALYSVFLNTRGVQQP